MSSMTFTELEAKYNEYVRKECDGERVLRGYFGGFSKETAFPGRCNAAKEYVKRLRDFIKETKEATENSIDNDNERLIQRIKNEEHKDIYPMLNHDFDYATVVKKTYNPFQLGITNQPTMGGLESGIKGSKKFVNAMVSDRFPNEKTISGVSDAYIENPTKNKIIELTRKEDNKLPYPSFRKDYPECMYPTKGEYSSSYFTRVGRCPTKISDKDACIQKGYQWVDEEKPPSEINQFLTTKSDREIKEENAPASNAKPLPPAPPKGTCFKPRFIYVNNRSDGIGGMNGIVPSSLSDIRAIAPDRLMTIMQGYTVAGSGLLPCTEGFASGKGNTEYDNQDIDVFSGKDTEQLVSPRLKFLLSIAFVLIVGKMVLKRRT